MDAGRVALPSDLPGATDYRLSNAPHHAARIGENAPRPILRRLDIGFMLCDEVCRLNVLSPKLHVRHKHVHHEVHGRRSGLDFLQQEPAAVDDEACRVAVGAASFQIGSQTRVETYRDGKVLAGTPALNSVADSGCFMILRSSGGRQMDFRYCAVAAQRAAE